VLKKQRNGRKGGKRVESRVTRDDLSSGNGLAFGFGNCTLVAVVVHRNASPACNEISRPCVKVLSLFFLFFPFFFFFFLRAVPGSDISYCALKMKNNLPFSFLLKVIGSCAAIFADCSGNLELARFRPHNLRLFMREYWNINISNTSEWLTVVTNTL